MMNLTMPMLSTYIYTRVYIYIIYYAIYNIYIYIYIHPTHLICEGESACH